MQINSYASRIFNPEIRAYFDVDTLTVRNKIIKLLVPFKTFSFEYLFGHSATPSRSSSCTYRSSAS